MPEVKQLRSRPAITAVVVVVVAVVAGAVLLGLRLPAAGSAVCDQKRCTVTLAGTGAETDVDTSGLSSGLSTAARVTLENAGSGTAEFSVDEERARCVRSERVDVGGYLVTCTVVGEGELAVELAFEPAP